MAHANAVPVSGSKLDNRRVLAALIDLAVVGVGWAVLLAAAGVLGEPASEVGAPLTAVGIGWALYYYFACESGSGQTIGKRVMNLRVVGTDGAPAGMREIALRTVLRVVDGLFFYLVGLIVMLATRERRGRLGDLVGGTMIVSAEKSAPAVEMSAPEAPAAVSRVPIAESGPAFEPEVELEPETEVEPVVEVEPVEPDEPDEPVEPDVASPSLKELASDVTAVTEAPEREMEEEPEVEEEPAADVEEEPVVEVEEEQPAAELDEEPEAEAEPDEEVTVKSVETVSAIDLVMQEDDEEAVAGPQAKARPS
jgi:uncharacterized RDD family membrane protein YckC